MNPLRLQKQLASAIKSWRMAANLRQDELAAKATVSIATLKRIEAGGNQKIFDYLKAMAVLNPNAMRRLNDALIFDPSDFTTNPLQGLLLTEKIRTKKRVKHEKS